MTDTVTPEELLDLVYQNEALFQAAIVQLAEPLGWLCYHTHDSRRSQPGYPDLTMVRGPEIIYAELKMPKKYPTPKQRAWLEAIGTVAEHTPYVRVYLWRPRDWPQIEEVLR